MEDDVVDTKPRDKITPFYYSSGKTYTSSTGKLFSVASSGTGYTCEINGSLKV